MIKNLKMLRTRAGISQQQLADILSVTQQSVNKYENHDTEPDLETLVKIAEYFNTSVDFLIGHTDIDHIIEPVSEYNLNDDEKHIIDNYRKLSDIQKKSISMILECCNDLNR